MGTCSNNQRRTLSSFAARSKRANHFARTSILRCLTTADGHHFRGDWDREAWGKFVAVLFSSSKRQKKKNKKFKRKRDELLGWTQRPTTSLFLFPPQLRFRLRWVPWVWATEKKASGYLWARPFLNFVTVSPRGHWTRNFVVITRSYQVQWRIVSWTLRCSGWNAICYPSCMMLEMIDTPPSLHDIRWEMNSRLQKVQNSFFFFFKYTIKSWDYLHTYK